MSDTSALKNPVSLPKKRYDFHTLNLEKKHNMLRGLADYRRKVSLEKISQRDPACVRQDAQYLVQIRDDCIRVKRNSSGRLPIIAVTGMAVTPSGIVVQDAVKLEIGLGRSYPYQRVERQILPRNGRKRLEFLIPARTKWASLSSEEYGQVAPILFDRIQSLANIIAESWKEGIDGAKYFFPLQTWIPPEKRHWQTQFGWIPKGVRFKASLKDTLLVSDIFWAELNQNKHLKEYLNWRVIKFGRRLIQYKNGYRNSFLKLKKVQQVRYLMENLFIAKQMYLLVEIAEELHRQTGISRDDLYDLIGWDREECWEHVVAKQALPNPKSRIKDIQIRVIRRNARYIVFEVYPASYK